MSKKLFLPLITVVLFLILTCSVLAFADTQWQYGDQDIDYLALIEKCVQNGSEEAMLNAAYYESVRNLKIYYNQSPYRQTHFLCSPADGEYILKQIEVYKQFPYQEELLLLSKIIMAEAGASRMSMEWKLAVGEVVLNRVASPEYPNTLKEVIYQKGQYQMANTDYFRNLEPTDKCIEAAQRLLNGERFINDPSVVFQAEFKQGSGVFKTFHDSYYGTTYICHSENMHYYK